MDKKIPILSGPHVFNQTILSLTYSYLSVISLLLLLCNDIHPNPGPLSNNSRCELQYTPSVSTIILSGPTYSSQNVPTNVRQI